MTERITGEEFTYTFYSEISKTQLDGYKKLQDRMNRAAKMYDGYLKQVLSFEPDSSGEGYHSTARISFTSLELCLAWLDSPERREILNEAESVIDYKYNSLVEPHSFNQWLESRQGSKIPVWKINLLVWLALYPSVMILIVIGQSTLGKLPLPLNMLISNAITVGVTGWWLVPWLSRRYEKWLQNQSMRWNILYSSSIVGFLLLFLLFFDQLSYN